MANYDPQIANILLSNFSEAHRTAKLLNSSYQRMTDIMPLTEDFFNELDDNEKDKLDAFRVRFADLQDCLGNKIFRSILLLEEEVIGSQLDILNKIAKREIISSFEDWKKMRNIRNIFSHDYPEHDLQKAEALNIAYKMTPELIKIFNEAFEYVKNTIKLSLKNIKKIS
jgi:uncharacterized protein with HEPN domain